MRNLFVRLLPFIFLGIMLVIFVAGLVLLSYILIIGAIAGLVLFAIAWLRETLFPRKDLTLRKPKQGRVFDHEDKK